MITDHAQRENVKDMHQFSWKKKGDCWKAGSLYIWRKLNKKS
jgi:hypothetical protein